MTISFHVVGDSCGHHGPYTFYRSFEFCKKNGRPKRISLGEFFFVRFEPDDDDDTVCIGELQLLWDDKNVGRTLTSCRLYYLPEHTPEGRHGHHGEDEVLAVSEKVVLCADDLVQRIVSDVHWTHGLKGLYAEETDSPSASVTRSDCPSSASETVSKVTNNVRSSLRSSTSNPSGTGLVETFIANNNLGSSKKCAPDGKKSNQFSTSPDETMVKVLSFPIYCRYRAILKRLENVTETWLRNTLVVALGGFTVSSRNCRLLFCRSTFDHLLLEGHELLHNHLAPTLKGRPRKKRLKNKRSTSPSSESNENESEEGRVSVVKEERPRNGLKKQLAEEDLEEQEFLQRLFKFMRKRNTPIERVPHLGFKQINLYFFYTYAQKLGGYEKITLKKLWKHIYDELGGNPGSTSAATCTRRHYERLLLPYERHSKGEDDVPLPPVTTTKCRKNSNASNPPPAPTPSPTQTNSSTQNPPSPSSSVSSARPLSPDNTVQCIEKKCVEDIAVPMSSAVASPPSPVPQSPKEATTANDEQLIVPKESDTLSLPCQPPSDPPLKTVTADDKFDGEHVDGKKQVVVQPRPHLPVALPTPQVYQQQRKRAKDEKFAEKERMWDEIRRQNAIERDRIRQLAAAARTANSSRVVKAKDLLPKPMGVVNPLETAAPHVTDDSALSSSAASGNHGSLMCTPTEFSESSCKSNWLPSTNNISPVPQTASFAAAAPPPPPPPPQCVPCAPLPSLIIKKEDSANDCYSSALVDKPKMKRSQPDYVASIREQFATKKPCNEIVVEAKLIKTEVHNSWRPFQEDCVLNPDCCSVARPSVIQHTHSANSAHLPIGHNISKRTAFCDPFAPEGSVSRSECKTSFGESPYPCFLQGSSSGIPVAHCNSVKCAPRYHPYDRDSLGPESVQQRMDAMRYKVAEVSPLPPLPVTDTSRCSVRPVTSPWSSASPHCHSLNNCDKPPHLDDDCVVLDLSVKKNTSQNRWTNGHMDGVTPLIRNNHARNAVETDVRELDLSMKSKPKCLEVRVTGKQQSFKSAPKKNCIPVHFQMSEDSKPVQHCREAMELRYSDKKVSPLPSQGPNDLLQSNTSGSLRVMPSHYYFSEDKAPAYFPDYGQISALLPSHYYGLPFPVSSPQPPLIPEHLQGSLTTYKELLHKGVFPTAAASQYPSFAFSHLYPRLYKEQSPYLYLPK